MTAFVVEMVCEMTPEQYGVMTSLWRALGGPVGWRRMAFLAERYGWLALAECARQGWLREGQGVMLGSATVTVEGLSALVGHYQAIGVVNQWSAGMPSSRSTLPQDSTKSAETAPESEDDWNGAAAYSVASCDVYSWEYQNAD